MPHKAPAGHGSAPGHAAAQAVLPAGAAACSSSCRMVSSIRLAVSAKGSSSKPARPRSGPPQGLVRSQSASSWPACAGFPAPAAKQPPPPSGLMFWSPPGWSGSMVCRGPGSAPHTAAAAAHCASSGRGTRSMPCRLRGLVGTLALGGGRRRSPAPPARCSRTGWRISTVLKRRPVSARITTGNASPLGRWMVIAAHAAGTCPGEQCPVL